MRRLRVALVVPGGFDPERRHVIPSLVWFVERLARRHDVHVFVLRYFERPCRYAFLGATVHDLGKPTARPGWRSIVQWRHLVNALAQNGPFDVIHGVWAVPAGAMAATAARVLGVPSVVSCDSGEFADVPDIGYGLQGSWRGRVAVAMATRVATTVHVCSEFMARHARAHRLEPHVIPFGIDLSLFERTPRSPPPRSATTPNRRVLHVASLNRVKGLTSLLRAIAALKAQGTVVSLDVVGEDTLGGAAAAECAALGIEDLVQFHGFRRSEELEPFYREAHVLALPSRHEAAGVVVLEAAAAGLVTVGSACGYVADWAPAAAVAVPPGDVMALAGALAHVLGDERARTTLAEAAAARVRAYDADLTTASFERLYLRLAEGGDGAQRPEG